MDDFFKIVSRAVIVVPIVVVVLALLFRFNQAPSSATKSSKSASKPSTTVAPSPTPAKKIIIDFNGPLVCRYKTANQEYDVYIKNKKVNLQFKVAGQTLKYDLSKYVPYAENLLNNDFSTAETMVNQYFGKKVSIESLLKTCKKESF
ncbi:hypothetical protein M1328_05690 [Patescibacteria group bacterium]|nr:hypothetical protein [Patescibacteria group bacterium]